MAQEIRRCIPNYKNDLLHLLNDEHQRMEANVQEIGELIRNAGDARSSAAKGLEQHGQSMLSGLRFNWERCWQSLSRSEFPNILLSIQSHKRPGTTGVCGVAYRRHAHLLAAVFEEAWDQLLSDDYLEIPQHIHETLWIPIPKLSAPSETLILNEDAKVLERIASCIVDEQASDQLRPVQKAFVAHGEIMHCIVGMHEAFRHTSCKEQL